MKIKVIIGFIALCVAILIWVYTGYDVCKYGKQTVGEVICYGPTVMKETIVTGDIKVTGSLRAENFSANSLDITGKVEIRNAQINKTVNITGPLRANNVNFSQGIAVNAADITLNRSRVNGLVTITSKNATPYLQVQCGSSITGSVFFDGKAGVVQITGDSIVQGKVVNGSLEFVKRDCN